MGARRFPPETTPLGEIASFEQTEAFRFRADEHFAMAS